MSTSEIVFWVVIAAIAYAYVGYALLVFILAQVVRRPVRCGEVRPKVTLLITAYNEEKNLARKIEQSLKSDYPRDLLEILVASDGSIDRTDEIAKSYASQGVRLLRVEGRVGKTQTQNVAVTHASGEIVVFSDATTNFEPTAITALIRNFADPTVGAVGGRFRYINPSNAAVGKGNIAFWEYETQIRRAQTRVQTITGCSGCIYAVRKTAYRPLPPDIISDLCEPLKVVEQGMRVVFEEHAMAFEVTTDAVRDEFSMRVRVILRGMRGLLYMRALLNPLRHTFIATQLWSHKVLRWFVPEFAMILLMSNLLLWDRAPFYRVTLLLQLTFYVWALLTFFTGVGRKSRLLALPQYFVTINAAAVVALVRLIRGHRAIIWETVRR